MFGRSIIRLLVVLIVTLPSRLDAQGCGNITTGPFGHDAVYFNDPTNQQRVLFDLTLGGAINSVQYYGVEYVRSDSNASLAQSILYSGGFQPTTAGDRVGHGSSVLGVQCDANSVWITSGLLDFNQGASGGTPGYQVNAGNFVWDALASPLVSSTYARWVQNRRLTSVLLGA